MIAWQSETEGTGSLRSIAGVDIGAVVREAANSGLLLKGGGHAMAAGLTVAPGRIDEVSRFFLTKLRHRVTERRDVAGLEIDGALATGGATEELLALVERAGPFGQGNPSPRFVFPSHRVRSVKVLGEQHVRCTIEAGDGARLDAIAFRAVGSPVGAALLSGVGGLPMHFAGHLRRDTWGGRGRIELAIEDIADTKRQ
jgi:single-stranded-DNA-specific exonuclease